MKILLATSSVTPNAGIPSFNRELCRLLNVENEMHLLVDENIESYRGYAKIYSITGINIYLSSTYKCNFLGADNKQ